MQMKTEKKGKERKINKPTTSQICPRKNLHPWLKPGKSNKECVDFFKTLKLH